MRGRSVSAPSTSLQHGWDQTTDWVLVQPAPTATTEISFTTSPSLYSQGFRGWFWNIGPGATCHPCHCCNQRFPLCGGSGSCLTSPPAQSCHLVVSMTLQSEQPCIATLTKTESCTQKSTCVHVCMCMLGCGASGSSSWYTLRDLLSTGSTHSPLGG